MRAEHIEQSNPKCFSHSELQHRSRLLSARLICLPNARLRHTNYAGILTGVLYSSERRKTIYSGEKCKQFIIKCCISETGSGLFIFLRKHNRCSRQRDTSQIQTQKNILFSPIKDDSGKRWRIVFVLPPSSLQEQFYTGPKIKLLHFYV